MILSFFFYFRIFNMSFHCLLASLVSDEKSAINLFETHLDTMSHFCLASFFVFVFWQFNYVSRCGSLWVYPTWTSLNFFHVYINSFQQIWEVYRHYLFKYSLCPFFSFSPWPPLMHMLVCLIVSTGFWGFVHFSLFCSLCSSDCAISIDLSLSSLFYRSNMLLILSGKFFISVIVICNSRISFWFLFIIPIFINILYMIRCHFTFSFSSLDIISFSSLDIC